jgi:hypothetical protein
MARRVGSAHHFVSDPVSQRGESWRINATREKQIDAAKVDRL